MNIPSIKVNIKNAKGPKGNLLFGAALDFKKDPIQFILDTEHHFPGFSRFRFVYIKMVFLSDPEYVRHVLQNNNKNYKKGIEYEHLKPVLGEGLLTSEGDFWLRQRRLAQPAFHKDRIASFFSVMCNCTDQMLNEWKLKQGSIDLHAEMMHLALDIVARTLLSADVKAESNEIEHALSVSIEESYHRVKTLINFPLWLPVPRHLRYNTQRKKLDHVVNKIIEQRRKSGEKFDDLLDMLMSVEDADTNEKMSDKQLRDEVMTIFLAGHETTANALTWTFYLLARNPEVLSKLKQEINDVLKGKNPHFDDLKNMPYTLQVIHEVLRLYPPAWALGRSALTDDVIDGYPIKKGDNIFISPYVIHRSPRFWENADQFIPERFSPDKLKELHKFVYFPFGGGPRFCIGNSFAMMEMQIIIPMILQKFTIELVKNEEVIPEPLVTLRPKGGLPVHLIPNQSISKENY